MILRILLAAAFTVSFLLVVGVHQHKSDWVEVDVPSVSVNDVAFGVITGSANFFTRMRWAEQTWMVHAPVVRVFAETTMPEGWYEDIHQDPITWDPPFSGQMRKEWGHRESAYKYYAAIKRMAEGNGYAWYFLGDDDTLPFPKCIAQHLSKILIDPWIENRWIGQKCPEGYCGGAGVILSRAALLTLSAALPECLRQYSGYYADLTITRCLTSEGIVFDSVDWLRSQPPLYFYTKAGRAEYPNETSVRSVCSFHYNDVRRYKELLDTTEDEDLFRMTFDEHSKQ